MYPPLALFGERGELAPLLDRDNRLNLVQKVLGMLLHDLSLSPKLILLVLIRFADSDNLKPSHSLHLVVDVGYEVTSCLLHKFDLVWLQNSARLLVEVVKHLRNARVQGLVELADLLLLLFAEKLDHVMEEPIDFALRKLSPVIIRQLLCLVHVSHGEVNLIQFIIGDAVHE